MDHIIKNTSYKYWLIVGAVLLVTEILLDSFLFQIMLNLLKVALLIGGLAALVYAGYLAWPDLKKLYEEKSKQES